MKKNCREKKERKMNKYIKNVKRTDAYFEGFRRSLILLSPSY